MALIAVRWVVRPEKSVDESSEEHQPAISNRPSMERKQRGQSLVGGCSFLAYLHM